jgi:hypothetical protein
MAFAQDKSSLGAGRRNLPLRHAIAAAALAAVVAVGAIGTAGAASASGTAVANVSGAEFGPPLVRLAQAGSAGGSVTPPTVGGNEGKSVSGGAPAAAPPPARYHRPPQRPAYRPPRQPAGLSLPQTIRLNEHALFGNFSVVLQRTSGDVYQGTWSHGYVTTFTVTKFTSDALEMDRTDNPTFGAASGHYTGHRMGASAQGSATLTMGVSTVWDASW